MKQKGRRKKFMSFLLAFAMLVGCLSGPVFVKQTAEAAGGGTIELGQLENHGTYYTYPDANVKMSDTNKKFYDMTITVDSGYFKIPQSKLDATKAMGILSDGTIADNYMSADDKFVEVSTDSQYSTIVFSWKDGTTKAKLDDFISRVQFVTTSSASQIVSISATTLNDNEKKVNLNGSEVYLKYFNGHFYAFGGWGANATLTWDQAYKLCKKAEFGGVKGYLATITSRAEDRFIFSNFWNSTGWLGCTRAKLAEGSAYGDDDIEWQPIARMKEDNSNAQEDFVWKWITGPETDTEFGYQTSSQNSTTTGGFQTYDNHFSNWGTEKDGDGFSEPNGGGGIFPQEAFGYYGQYMQGRWNDHRIDDTHGFYIEFGGFPGDDEKFNETLGEQTYTVTKDSADDSDDPINDGKDDKDPLRGDVEILNRDPYQNCVVGTPLEADITDILDRNEAWDLDPEQDLSYQWLRQDKNGVPVIIDGATDRTYNLTEEDLGNKIIVRVTVEKNDDEGTPHTYLAESNPYNTSVKDNEHKKVEIGGVVLVEEDGKASNGDPIVKANIDGVTPEGAKPVLDYQWYIYDPDKDSYEKIDGANEPTYTVPADNQGKQLVVTVTPNEEKGEDYEGAVTSTPYTVTDKNSPKEPISGVVTIENKTLDDDDIPVVKAGTILSADTKGVIPEGAQPTLTYQWFVTNDDGLFQPIPGATDKNYILKEDDIDRKVAVVVYGDEVDYTGSVSSVPYDAKRTNADIGIDPNPGEDPGDGKRVIKVTPTAESTGYTVWEFITQKVPEDLVVKDENGNELTPDEEGYYSSEVPGGILYFYVDKDKSYDIKERQIIRTNTETLGIQIEDPKTEYDPSTDTITITVDPAKPDYQYAVLKKVDGIYQPVTITRDENGNYVFDKDSTTKWSDGKQEVVTFTKLPADGTYRIVAIPCELEDGRNPDDIDPSKIIDGSKEIDATELKKPTESLPIEDPKTSYDKETDTITIAVDPAKTDYQYAILKKDGNEYKPVTVTIDSNGNYVFDEKGTTVWSTGNQGVVTYTKLPADGTYRIVAIPISSGKDVNPGNVTNGSKDIVGSEVKASANQGTQYTKAEEDKAEKFIKDYVTDAKKKLITKVNDATRDIIISGESTWKKMTAREKAAVNEKLKARGCPYTYEQLLAMAKKWKIPSFNMRKLMKKGTKSKVKMVKCKGATIITTSTNKKVATISKKGVIKAKKVGKANLTITAIKGKYTNRLVIRLIVKKKFKNAKELKKLKAKQIKTPTLLLNKQRKLNKSTKIGIVDLNKKSKVKYKSFNTKNFTINKKGRYKAKRLGSSLIRTTVKQNNKTYILYLYLTGIK